MVFQPSADPSMQVDDSRWRERHNGTMHLFNEFVEINLNIITCIECVVNYVNRMSFVLLSRPQLIAQF